MRISYLKNLAKRAADQRSRWRSSAYPVSGVSAQSQFLQQCRGYYSRSHNNQLSTTRVSNAPFCHVFPFLRKSYSSSSSSNSRKGFLAWYLGMLDSRPILTKSISSALIYAAADSTSQVFFSIYLSFKFNYSWRTVMYLRFVLDCPMCTAIYIEMWNPDFLWFVSVRWLQCHLQTHSMLSGCCAWRALG